MLGGVSGNSCLRKKVGKPSTIGTLSRKMFRGRFQCAQFAEALQPVALCVPALSIVWSFNASPIAAFFCCSLLVCPDNE